MTRTTTLPLDQLETLQLCHLINWGKNWKEPSITCQMIRQGQHLSLLSTNGKIIYPKTALIQLGFSIQGLVHLKRPHNIIKQERDLSKHQQEALQQMMLGTLHELKAALLKETRAGKHLYEIVAPDLPHWEHDNPRELYAVRRQHEIVILCARGTLQYTYTIGEETTPQERQLSHFMTRFTPMPPVRLIT